MGSPVLGQRTFGSPPPEVEPLHVGSKVTRRDLPKPQSAAFGEELLRGIR